MRVRSATRDSDFLRWLYGPAWRWMKALELHNSPDELPTRLDPRVRQAVAYLGSHRHSESATTGRGRHMFGRIAAALETERTLSLAQPLQLLVLAGVPDDKIVSSFGGTSDLVQTWRELFFDISECRTARIWLEKHVFDPTIHMDDYEHVKNL